MLKLQFNDFGCHSIWRICDNTQWRKVKQFISVNVWNCILIVLDFRLNLKTRLKMHSGEKSNNPIQSILVNVWNYNLWFGMSDSEVTCFQPNIRSIKTLDLFYFCFWYLKWHLVNHRQQILIVHLYIKYPNTQSVTPKMVRIKYYLWTPCSKLASLSLRWNCCSMLSCLQKQFVPVTNEPIFLRF